MQTNITAEHGVSSHHSAFDLRNLKHAFLVLFALGIAYSFPIWLTERYYIDDIGRSMWGYTGWEANGRYFASLFTSALNFQSGIGSGILIDISPLPQILAVGALAFAAAMLHQQLFGTQQSITSLLVVFPIIGSPFLLENLSYKFDSFSMALGITSSVAAAISHRGKIVDLAIGSLLITLAFGLYQASVNVFLGASILLFLNNCIYDKPDWRPALSNLIKLPIGYLIYIKVVLGLHPLDMEYSLPSSTPVSMNSEGLQIFFKNLSTSMHMVAEYFLQIPAMSAIASVAVIVYGIRFISQGNPPVEKLIRLILLVFASLGLLFSISGLLLFLKVPIFEPRTFVGFSVLLVFLFYCFETNIPTRFHHFKHLLWIPTFYLFFTSYGYSAAAKEQTRYDRHLAAGIIAALENAGFGKESYLTFDGTQPKSAVLQNSSKVKIIDRLVQLHINNEWSWGYHYMHHAGLSFNRLALVDREIVLNLCASPPIYRSNRFRIFKASDKFLVAFENGVCFQRN